MKQQAKGQAANHADQERYRGKRQLKHQLVRLIIGLLVFGLFTMPVARAQEAQESSQGSNTPPQAAPDSVVDPAVDPISDSLASLDRLAASLTQPQLTLNKKDIADWQALLENQRTNLQKHDRRAMTQLLPYLSNEAPEVGPLVIDQIRRKHDSSETEQTTYSDGSRAVSPLAFGKGAVVSAVGVTRCFDDVLFPQRLSPIKPLWLVNSSQPASQSQLWPFGWSFDRLVQESFWLESRGFTNRPISPRAEASPLLANVNNLLPELLGQTDSNQDGSQKGITLWKSFLVEIAKTEIEERFGLAPGALRLVSTSQLGQTAGSLRLAQTLGLPFLPSTASEAGFYQELGRRQLETGLGLPAGSLQGATKANTSWRDIYQNIGLRTLEDQFNLGANSSANGSTDPLKSFQEESQTAGFQNQSLAELPRFKAISQYLEERGIFYTDPRRALNLPTEEYLPTGAGQNTIYQRLINGDPEAYTVVGAYSLAQTMNLSNNATKALLAHVEAGQDGTLTLSEARPLPVSYRAESFFSATFNTADLARLFEELGRKYQDGLTTNLARLSDELLLAVSGSNRTPDYKKAMAVFTNEQDRASLLAALAEATSIDANYPDGFSVEALSQRGAELLAAELKLKATDLENLESLAEDSQAQTQFQQITEAIDRAMHWSQLPDQSPSSSIEDTGDTTGITGSGAAGQENQVSNTADTSDSGTATTNEDGTGEEEETIEASIPAGSSGSTDSSTSAQGSDSKSDPRLSVSAQLVLGQGSSLPLNAAQAKEKQRLALGAQLLWERLDLSDELGQQLDDLYFNASLPTSSVSADSATDSETNSENNGQSSDQTNGDGSESGDESNATDSSNQNTNDGDSSDEEETVEIFAITAEQKPLADGLRSELHLPSDDAAYFINGQMMPALIRTTLSLVGTTVQEAELGNTDNLLLPEKLISLFDQTTANGSSNLGEQLDQLDVLADQPIIDPLVMASLKQAQGPGKLAELWSQLQFEAIRQWNLSCPDKTAEIKEEVNSLVKALVELPNDPTLGLPTGSLAVSPTTQSGAVKPFRPVQIMIENLDDLTSETKELIAKAYPGADGKDKKYGVKASPRLHGKVMFTY